MQSEFLVICQPHAWAPFPSRRGQQEAQDGFYICEGFYKEQEFIAESTEPKRFLPSGPSLKKTLQPLVIGCSAFVSLVSSQVRD